MRGVFNYNLTNTISHKPPASKPSLPPDLGKPETRLEVRSDAVDFSQSCVESRVPHDIKKLPPRSHTAAKLLAHIQEKGVPIFEKRGMIEQELMQTCATAHTPLPQKKQIS